MKNRILRVFLLIFWALGICTFLSLWIEDEMTPEVVTVKGEKKPGTYAVSVPLGAFMEDENGVHLYETAEGTGWENGLHAYEVSPSDYEIGDNEIMDRNGSERVYVRYASKNFRDEDSIKKVNKGEKEQDWYLCIGSSESFGELPEDVKIEDATENAKIFSLQEGAPFMADYAHERLMISDETDIYSLREVTEFMNTLPWLASALALCLITVILWVYGFLIPDKGRENQSIWAENRARSWTNVAIGIVTMVYIAILLRIVHLPSSLLPLNNILEWKHYAGEFSQIVDALKNFENSEKAYEILKTIRHNLLLSGGIPAGGLLIGGCLIAWFQARRLRRLHAVPKA